MANHKPVWTDEVAELGHCSECHVPLRDMPPRRRRFLVDGKWTREAPECKSKALFRPTTVESSAKKKGKYS